MNDRVTKEDILKELFNISVGQSASLLSEVIEKRILLNVPDVKVINYKENSPECNNYISKFIEGALMISSISFREQLAGKASLVFPAEKMRTFINLCMHESTDFVPYDLNFTDVDFDIVKEIGNIVLNSIIGELGNFINVKFSYSIPEIKVINEMNIDKVVEDEDYTYILMLYITFNIEDTEIDGAIMINLTLKSLDELLKKIGKIEEEFNE